MSSYVDNICNSVSVSMTHAKDAQLIGNLIIYYTTTKLHYENKTLRCQLAVTNEELDIF